MLFYFDFDNWLRMIRLAWRETSPKAKWYYLAVLCIGTPIIVTFHAVCFALDWVLFPGLRKVEVKEPVILLGHARSGTTLTHRLMSQDKERFSYFLLWECYFPSLLQKKLIRAGIAFDRRVLRGLLGKLATKYEDWKYGSFRQMHFMSLTTPEEDDISLYWSMASGFWITKMPYMGDLDFYWMNEWPEAKRRRYNDMYRELVRRQLYLNGPEKTHLAKNPLWAGRVQSLIQAFPDARFVVNIRDPRENIPSLLKLMRASWKSMGWDEARQQKCLDVLLSQSWSTTRHPIEMLDAHPETRGSIVDYRDLTSDPAATIERVYKELGMQMTDAHRELLAAEGARESKHKGGHSYSLEEFGIEGDLIRENLGDLFERFQWDSADAPPNDA